MSADAAVIDTPSERRAAAAVHEVSFDKVTKRFFANDHLVRAVDEVSLDIERGEFVCFLGPSGCGKSTLLNMVAGLVVPSGGEVRHQSRRVPTPNTSVGYITQKDNLLPWRTVRRNIEIALELKRLPLKLYRDRVDEMIAMVGLAGFEDAYPSQLSGGMRKRVTLARTLVHDPQLILADEPFGALDAQLKLVLGDELLRLRDDGRGRTFVFVTHDINEAISLGDRIVAFSPRPGRVKLDCRVPLPRPRDFHRLRSTPEYAEVYEKVWEVIATDLRAGEAGA